MRIEFKPRRLSLLELKNGKKPFERWVSKLKDKIGQAKIFQVLVRLEVGESVEYKFIKDGVFELKIHFGPGYRIYFALVDDGSIVVLLGGTKKSQNRDIKKALRYWKDCKQGLNYDKEEKNKTCGY